MGEKRGSLKNTWFRVPVSWAKVIIDAERFVEAKQAEECQVDRLEVTDRNILESNFLR